MKRTAVFIAFSLCAGTAFAQGQTRRATMTGSRGDRGKCTIVLEVDGAAEVEIRGAEGRIRNLAGQPAYWLRFECTDPLPRNPEDFRFRGIDGRGPQTLIRDPRQTGGVAVIRIEDPKGGREGYTSEIEWRGYANSPYNGGGPGGQRDDRWNSDRPGFEGNRGRRDARDAIETCKNAVRAKANSDYRLDEVNFGRAQVEDNPGRRDWISGTFRARRGNRRAEFSFTCSVDLSSGQVRRVNVTPLDR